MALLDESVFSNALNVFICAIGSGCLDGNEVPRGPVRGDARGNGVGF